MTEYIEREAALEESVELYYWCGYEDRYGYFVPVDAIQCIQPADVASVRHGQWEPGNPICPVCGENKFKDLDADIWCDWMPDFCPNCGAKMDLEG